MEDTHRQNACYLLFWPAFGLRYLLIEQFHPAKVYHPVHCAMDDRIPFLEGFLLPYVLWYFCIIGTHLWLYIRDDPAFSLYSRYLILTTMISTAVFLGYPTCQNLRPAVFPRENRLTEIVGMLYSLDTCTNVCPSEHVIGSAGFYMAVHYAENTTRRGKAIACLTAVLTAVSTVFLKQHSAVDVIAAVPVCAAGWYVSFRPLIKEKDSRKAG